MKREREIRREREGRVGGREREIRKREGERERGNKEGVGKRERGRERLHIVSSEESHSQRRCL
jgi:hypothetical protein